MPAVTVKWAAEIDLEIANVKSTPQCKDAEITIRRTTAEERDRRPKLDQAKRLKELERENSR